MPLPCAWQGAQLGVTGHLGLLSSWSEWTPKDGSTNCDTGRVGQGNSMRTPQASVTRAGDTSLALRAGSLARLGRVASPGLLEAVLSSGYGRRRISIRSSTQHVAQPGCTLWLCAWGLGLRRVSPRACPLASAHPASRPRCPSPGVG